MASLILDISYGILCLIFCIFGDCLLTWFSENWHLIFLISYFIFDVIIIIGYGQLWQLEERCRRENQGWVNLGFRFYRLHTILHTIWTCGKYDGECLIGWWALLNGQVEVAGSEHFHNVQTIMHIAQDLNSVELRMFDWMMIMWRLLIICFPFSVWQIFFCLIGWWSCGGCW